MPDEPITTKSAAERFIKAHIRPQARIGPGVIDALILRLNQLTDEAIRKADGLATAGDRTTILERDLSEAFQTVTPGGSGQPSDPMAVFAQLDRMTTDQLAALVRKIQEWLATRPR
jgi:histone H3/H4